VDAWNSLPDNLKSSNSVVSFKRGLQYINFSKFLKGSVFK
jgi:hypothetical protein